MEDVLTKAIEADEMENEKAAMEENMEMSEPDMIANLSENEPEEQPAPENVRKEKSSRPETVPSRPQQEHTIIGVQSDEIIAEAAREKSAEEIEEKNFNDLRRYQRNGEILWGEVYGVEASPNLGSAIIAVLWNGIKVSIPDSEYFEDTFFFGNNYEGMSAKEKLNKRTIMARYQIGAKVCFCVKGTARTKIEFGEFAGEYMIDVVASRKEAMAKVRDIWFLHKNRKSRVGTPREVHVNDIAKANVLAVKEDVVVVECLGVESRLDCYNLNDDIVENCRDFVKPGDVIPVRVRKVYVNADDTVYLTVSGRLNNASKMIHTMRERSNYLGQVDHYNKAKDRYTVMLKNGVTASVPSSMVQGGVPLTPGDDVAVMVTRIMDAYVIGAAIKL